MEAGVQTDPKVHFIEVALEEYRNWKAQADRALAQTDDRAFFAKPDEESNGIAFIMKHVAGSLKSRWTDFLTTDGEKPSRDRDSEFEDTGDTRAAIVESWEDAWRRTFVAVEALTADGSWPRWLRTCGSRLVQAKGQMRAGGSAVEDGRRHHLHETSLNSCLPR
jgi:hypothetical protein